MGVEALTTNTKPILVLDTGLPLGVYRAVEDAVEVHRINYQTIPRTTTPNPDYDPTRPTCACLPCYGREDACPNVSIETAWRLEPA